MPRKGENIYKRKDGRWEARYIHHYEKGKAKYKSVYASNYKEVKDKKLSLQSKSDLTEDRTEMKVTAFETLASLWLADIKVSIKESTYTRYFRIIYKYLIPLLGGKTLSEQGMQSLNNIAETLLKTGGIRQKGLSPKTVTDIICVLKSILKYGKEHGCYVPNFNTIKCPPRSPEKVKIITGDNLTKIERHLMDSEDMTGLGIIFALFTGVRLGELCALRWGDIDFASSVVTVQRTVERIADLDPLTKTKTKIIVNVPKTGYSVRMIPIPGFLIAYLEKRRKENDCYILTGAREYIEPHRFYMRYKHYLKKTA